MDHDIHVEALDTAVGVGQAFGNSLEFGRRDDEHVGRFRAMQILIGDGAYDGRRRKGCSRPESHHASGGVVGEDKAQGTRLGVIFRGITGDGCRLVDSPHLNVVVGINIGKINALSTAILVAAKVHYEAWILIIENIGAGITEKRAVGCTVIDGADRRNPYGKGNLGIGKVVGF